MDITIISSLIGLIIGTTLALTGAGGAILSIPLLIVLLGLDFQQAAPLALLTVFTASAIGSIQGFIKKIVRYKAAMLIAVIGSAMAPLGVLATHHIPAIVLKAGLAIILVYVGIRTWRQTLQTQQNGLNAPAPCEVNPMTSKLFWTADCTKHLIGIGTLTGFLSGLLGVGGGFLIVPAFKKVTDLDYASIIATTLTITALISVSAFISHLQHSNIQWSIATPLLVCTLTSMLLVGQFRNNIPEQYSQKGFAILCLLAVVAMFV